MCLCVKLTRGQLYWLVLYVNFLSWTSIRSSCGAFSQLVMKGGGPIVGGAIPGLVVLSSIREQAEQARECKQASKEHPSTASASAPAL